MPDRRPRKAKAAQPRPTQSVRTPTDYCVVGIGASAGGLDACRKFVGALPAGSGMAFILVVHLDPAHESMMVDLLSGHTSLTVRQATDGMRIEREALYIIPPGTYLSAGNGTLHLSEPEARHGARLPFDFLLRSLANEYGSRAACVILSGTGADGSLGLRAVKEKGGLVVAQDPAEAGYDGMPRSAIATGAVGLVLPVAKIPDALVKFNRQMALAYSAREPSPKERSSNWLPEIIELLRTKTSHNFTLYKPGTLQRRIERRMAMASIRADDMNKYLELLRGDANELNQLAEDLLINVTSFFRDRDVFEFLAQKTVPDLVRKHLSDQPLRIWIAGCSTGEEAYSLAMLFREQITATTHNVKLQVFASDIDPDAVATAREGLYPEAIASDISTARLARFFTKEGQNYRVSPELRAAVVFTVQDVLADPPFSRLDLISCRNLLIYLRPEAQAKVVSLFKFALREDGVLLLGSSETVGNNSGFVPISKADRLYRYVGRNQAGETSFSIGEGGAVQLAARPGPASAPTRNAALADFCQRLVVENYAPATVLINQRQECVFSLGPTDRYLRLAPGAPTRDLLAMVRDDLRTKLRSTIQRAWKETVPIMVAGGSVIHDGKAYLLSISAQQVTNDGEQLLLICFVDEPKGEAVQSRPIGAKDISRVAELEQELNATRSELEGAIRGLEIAAEEQQAVNEEALSINEEYQSTNEELVTSKEELQSLNEELTALNSQLQETLELKRTTSNDLQNVLYSTNVATIFLDPDLNIRLYTPAAKLLFNVIPSDIGRPLADLSSLAADRALLPDARSVLHTLTPLEREIEAHSGAWYVRRVMPYRTQEDQVEGVVITFVDSSERHRIANTLEAANRQAQQATIAKSRFLAAASHDLRQPLQTLVLLQGLLTKTVEGEKAQKLVARLDETVGAMSSMLNTLLDINQIDAGAVQAEPVSFSVNDLLDRLRDEFTYHAEAQAQGPVLRVVPCSLSIQTDPRLLEQMLRNLLSNALKYTANGKVLLGCRRRKGKLSIEVWDTGVGIPETELQAIFDEYHQLDNFARQRSRGLGLGLSIVQRLGNLLGHRVSVRSELGRGSVFTIDVAIPLSGATPALERKSNGADQASVESIRRTGEILVIEDDAEVRDLLELLLKDEGYRTLAAADGISALEFMAHRTIGPDLVLADYNLPNGMDGLQVCAKLREQFNGQMPVIILTGDISTGTLRDIALQNCVRLNKPVKFKELTHAIERFLPATQSATQAAPSAQEDYASGPVIFVVDDDSRILDAIRDVLEEDGRTVQTYSTGEAFLQAYRTGREGCLLIDANLPGMSGLELLQHLNAQSRRLPAIMITGDGDVPMAVQAMKAGALDFIEKPISRGDLIASVERALERSHDASKLSAWREAAVNHLASLTPRQHQIMEMILAGNPNKNIAADLCISQRTVENHRAEIMKKTGSKSLPALARLALAAASTAAISAPNSAR